MLERSRPVLRASILLILSSPLVATTLAAVAQRDRALAEIARFAQGGPTPVFMRAERRAAWRDAERRQWAVSPMLLEDGEL